MPSSAGLPQRQDLYMDNTVPAGLLGPDGAQIILIYQVSLLQIAYFQQKTFIKMTN